jgi:hypothetical protein
MVSVQVPCGLNGKLRRHTSTFGVVGTRTVEGVVNRYIQCRPRRRVQVLTVGLNVWHWPRLQTAVCHTSCGDVSILTRHYRGPM